MIQLDQKNQLEYQNYLSKWEEKFYAQSISSQLEQEWTTFPFPSSPNLFWEGTKFTKQAAAIGW